jgi:hypothetical protein
LRANGGILSTVDDMLRWRTALEGTTILSAEAKKKMFTPHVREGAGDTYYGYGWMIGKDPWGGALVAHNGGNGVFFADFVRMIDAHLVVIVMTNDSTVRGGRIAESLARLARGEEVPISGASATRVTPLVAGPRETIVRGWLDAFNAPDAAPMRSWREAHAVPRPGTDDAERERRTKAMREDLGQLELEGVVSDTGEELTVRAKSLHGPVTLKFMFEDDGKVAGIGVEVGD